MQIIYLENNINICRLLFKNPIFKKTDVFLKVLSSSYLKILIKFNKIEEIRIILSNVLTKFNWDEMNNCLKELNKNIVSNYESIDLFFDLLIENFTAIKKFESFINQILFYSLNIIIDIDNEKIDELLKKESFRNTVFKMIYLLLNTDGNYNPKNDIKCYKGIEMFLKKMNDKSFLIEIFEIFYIDLYSMKDIFIQKEFNIKYLLLIKSKDNNIYSDLEIKPLNFHYFEYLTFIFQSFTSLTPIKEIIDFFQNYFKKLFILYQSFFLSEYNYSFNIALLGKNKNNFILCNFFHVFKSKTICCNFYFHLIKYVQSSNSDKKQLLTNFPDLKALLINLFYLCPFPFYFDIIIDIFNNSNEFKKYEIYFNELIEMILYLEYNDKYENKNETYFYNMIEFLKIFKFFSIKYKESSNYNNNKLKVYFRHLLIKIKKYNFIYSPYLIKIEENKKDNENSLKTLLEICFLCTISFLDIEDKSLGKNDLLFNIILSFVNDNKKDDTQKNSGHTIFFDFDSCNNLFNYNTNINENKKIKHNNDFNNYLFILKNAKKKKDLC